jgi:hypothetical protein
MANQILTHERLTQLFKYDPESGDFTRIWRDKGSCAKLGKAGTVAPSGYVYIRIDNILHCAHRLAWLYMTKTLPECNIDHINRIPRDNSFANLRQATQGQNMQNITKPSHNTSGYLGVTWHKAAQKWHAQICLNNKHINVGLFSDPKEAHEAYLKTKREIHSHCTY